MLIFEEKIYFWLLIIIPVILLLFLGVLLWKKRMQKKFADPALFKKLSPDSSKLKSTLKVIVFLLAMICLIFALINPKIGTEMETIKRKGVDIVFAIDVSRSMLAEDIAPNRLEKAKRLVTEIINNLKGDRVGIIGYAGSAFPQVPITTDYATAKIFLQGMNTNMVSSQGTAIKDAVELASTYYNDQSQTNRLLFIISDGEDHGGGLKEIAKESAKKGIRIYTIGLGSIKGAPIPIKQHGETIRYLKNNQGETVITKLNPETLKELAKMTDGEYIDGTLTSEVTNQVKEILQQVEKSEIETKRYAGYKDQFQWFLGFGIGFLLLELFLLDRKTAWLKRLDLFHERKK